MAYVLDHGLDGFGFESHQRHRGLFVAVPTLFASTKGRLVPPGLVSSTLQMCQRGALRSISSEEPMGIMCVPVSSRDPL